MIKVQNLEVFYDKIKVLDDINFHLKWGENVAIIGSNGCGKTTLLKCIVNTVEFNGNIYLDNKNIKEIKRRELAKKIAILSQIKNVNFSYSVFDTVLMGRYVHQERGFYKNYTKEDMEIVRAYLKTMDIFHLKDRSIDTLSGGQLQRVFLAKVIVQSPDILLLDEPTNHLDLKYQVDLINFLKTWARENDKTIIGVLHDINLALLLADNMLVLKNGKLLAFDNTQEILKSKILNDVYDMDIKEFMLFNLKRWQ